MRPDLNDPILVQFVNYIGDLLRGDMGISYQTNQPVTEDLWEIDSRRRLNSFSTQ